MSDETDFANLTFKMDCSRILLTRNGGDHFSVHGPGEIWQDEKGVLQFKVFVGQDQPMPSRCQVPLGKLIPEDEFFVLETGNRWASKYVLPRIQPSTSVRLATGSLRDLIVTRKLASKLTSDFITVRFRDKLTFPCTTGTETVTRVGGRTRYTSSTLNAAIFDDADLKFEVYHEEEHTVLSVEMPAGHASDIVANRIVESLQFVLGKQLAALVVVTTTGDQEVMRLQSPAPGHGKMLPPLQFTLTDFDGHFWCLFRTYFRKILQDKDAAWHPISCQISSAIESSAASLNVWVLALAVAVEGIASHAFKNLTTVDPTFMAELDVLQTEIAKIELTDKTRARLKGTLDSFRRPRGSDIVRAFIEKNELPRSSYESWQKLRNSSVHGDGTGGREIEDTVRLKDEVISLLYSMVFLTIGYQGLRSDYSQSGFPKCDWPIRRMNVTQ